MWPIEHNDNYVKEHFALNRWILQYAGLWAPDTNSKIIYYGYKTYVVVVFLFVNIYFTFTEFLCIMETYVDLELLIKNINFGLTHMMGAFKCVFWFIKGKCLIKIIDTLEDARFHYEDAPDFDPGSITKEAKRIGRKYTLSFFMLAHMTLSSSYIPALLTATFKPVYIEGANGTLIFNQRLPYFSWMPFSIETRGLYILALFYQAGPMWSYAYSIVGMDTLFMNIMNYVGAHLLILKGAFRTIRIRSVTKVNRLDSSITTDGLYNVPEVELQMAKEMKKSVIHLQTVIEFNDLNGLQLVATAPSINTNFGCHFGHLLSELPPQHICWTADIWHFKLIFFMCEELETIHKYLTLGQILATLFILCTSLFLVSMAPIASKQFAAEAVYMIAMGFQLVLYCWFGNEVTLRATEIPESLWHGDWLETKQSFKTSMMITMTRMRKPLYLTVGKFAPLTLTTFVAILKGSYSFFAVLKKVND